MPPGTTSESPATNRASVHEAKANSLWRERTKRSRMLGMVMALAGLAIVAGIVFVRLQRKRRADADDGVDAAGPKRPDTALGELREMREALGPAMHSRVERRPPAPPRTGNE